jgi:hypothetical protein
MDRPSGLPAAGVLECCCLRQAHESLGPAGLGQISVSDYLGRGLSVRVNVLADDCAGATRYVLMRYNRLQEAVG